jgi:O-antigen ligase
LVGFIAPNLLFFSLFLLGLPLSGTIPTPVDMFRESEAALASIEIIDNKVSTAIVWGGIYFLAFLLLFRQPSQSIRCIKNIIPLMGLLILALVSAIWSTNADKAIFDGLQLFGVMFVCVHASQYYRNDICILLKHASLAFGINLLIQFSLIIVFPQQTIQYDGRWAGTTGSANYLGSIAFCSIWANLSWMFFTGIREKLLSTIFLVVAFVVLLNTGSVTSIISTFVSILFIAYLWSIRPSKGRVAKISIFFVVIISMFAGSLFAGLGFFLELAGRGEGASGRDVIWLAAINLIQDSPVLGHGFGSDTESLGALHWATTFHNGYLEIGVKQGFVGLLFFLLVIFKVFKRLLAAKFNTEVRIILFAFMASYLVYNLAESAVLVARNPMWIMLLVLVSTIGLIEKKPNNKAIWK